MKRSPTLLLAALLLLRNVYSLQAQQPELLAFKTVIPELAQSHQLIIVTTQGWNDIPAIARCVERSTLRSSWKEALEPYNAVVGKKGMAWGLGLQRCTPAKEEGIVKKEGDLRAPAGIFKLGEVFGYAPSEEAAFIKMPYRQLTASMEGIDDIHSHYYNRIVDTTTLQDKDWTSSEAMLRSDDLYRWGIVIQHNWENVPGAGSCIFMHLWRGPNQGTAGCTALAPKSMESILHWLDAAKYPLLLQLPAAEYERLKESWQLP